MFPAIFNPMMTYVVAPLAIGTIGLLLAGCGGGDDDMVLGADGDPPDQDPFDIPDGGTDPCDGLEGQDLAECQAEDALPPFLALRFNAADHAYQDNPPASQSSSTFVVDRGDHFIPCSDVMGVMESFVNSDSVCFRATTRWASFPDEADYPVEESANLQALASVSLRSMGSSLCEMLYLTDYNGYYEDTDYPLNEDATTEVLNFCSDELPSYDGEVGFIYASTGVYNAASGQLHLSMPNTVAGANPPDLENPSQFTVLPLYSPSGTPHFGLDMESNPTGIIDNETLLLISEQSSVMTFDVGQGFTSQTIGLSGVYPDLEGNTGSSLSATLFTIEDGG